MRRAKRLGFSDAQIAYLCDAVESDVPRTGPRWASLPTFKTVDSCGAEFSAETPYHYSTYEDTDEVAPSGRPKVIILGAGPTASGKGSSSTTAVSTRALRSPTPGTRPSWSTATPRRCRPTTTPAIGSTSSRSRSKTSRTSSTSSNKSASEGNGPGIAGIIVSLGGQTPLKLAGLLPPELIAGTTLTASTWPRIASVGTPSAPNSRSLNRRAGPLSTSTERSMW